jgi:carboxylesterase type B
MAAHTIDIQFLFNNFHSSELGVNLDQATDQSRKLDARETKLSDQMVAAWTNFANTENPMAPKLPTAQVYRGRVRPVLRERHSTVQT